MSFAGKTMHRRLRDILPTLPIVFGLAEPEAAASIGISLSKFRELVADGRMPKPRQIDGRFVFDVDELRSAFKDLPHAGQAEGDTWADVVPFRKVMGVPGQRSTARAGFRPKCDGGHRLPRG